MPSTGWASLSPLLAIQRKLDGRRKKENLKKSDCKNVPESPAPSVSSPPPPPSVRFTRKDQMPTRTQKFRVDPPPKPPGLRPPAPVVSSTQAWPDPATLLSWVEDSIGHQEPRRRSQSPTPLRISASPRQTRTRTRSETATRDAPTWNWTTGTELIPIRGRSSSRGGEDRRSTGERLAAFFRSLSREKLHHEGGDDEEKTSEWRRSRSQRAYAEEKRRLYASLSQPAHHQSAEALHRPLPVPEEKEIIRFRAGNMPASAACSNCFTKYSMLNKEEGCSGCAMSFCRKCVAWKALVPPLSKKPLSVCRGCFDRLEGERVAREEREERERRQREEQQPSAIVTHTPMSSSVYPRGGPSPAAAHSSLYPQVGRGGGHPATSFFAAPQPHQSQSPSWTPSPSMYPSVSSHPSSTSSGVTPWWSAADLPPPSMRAEMGRGVPTRPARPLRGLAHSIGGGPPAVEQHHGREEPPPPYSATATENSDSSLEERARALREGMQPSGPPPSIESLEERLAALRGVDVDVVRNPRSMFHAAARPPVSDTESVARIVAEAEDRARLEVRFDPDRMLEERAARLMKKEEERKEEEGEGEKKTTEGTADSERLSAVPSVASRMSDDFSTATKEELSEISRMMTEAAKRVAEAEERGRTGSPSEGSRRREASREDVVREMGEADKLSKQVSLDIDKVNAELAGFWDKQNAKAAREPIADSSDEDEDLDDAAIERIVKEAESAPDIDEPVAEKKTVGQQFASPSKSEDGKKKGSLFGRIFKK